MELMWVNLKGPRKLASKVLKTGVNRIWIDPEKIDDVEGAITREEIRKLIHEGTIKTRADKGVSRNRARLLQEKRRRGLRKGVGTRRGKQSARTPPKKSWENRIRAIRLRLKKLKTRRVIHQDQYHHLYRMAKGGAFTSVAHMDQYIELHKPIQRR